MAEVLMGKNFVLSLMKGKAYAPVACATTTTITITQDVREATKFPNSRASQFYSGMYKYEITTDGLCAVDDSVVSAMDLTRLILGGASVQWMAEDSRYNNYYFSGFILPQSISLTSPSDGFHTFGLSATGDGDLKIDR